jgi:branched-subunit amino acid transport protein
MSDAWLAVLVVGGGTIAFKGAGPAILGGRRLPARLDGAVNLLAPALLAALVVDQGLASGRHLTFDARVGGIAAAAVAIALRLPLIAVIVVAAVATALLRLAY